MEVECLSRCEESSYVFAARYAHSRNTGAAHMVVKALMVNWAAFSEQTKNQILKETFEATHNDSDWTALRNFAIARKKEANK